MKKSFLLMVIQKHLIIIKGQQLQMNLFTKKLPIY